ncbi:MAG: hypothetical protein KME25_00980 [Symplocastrum torsivum CPER-KK1]|jgi:hypothetical protein|uniref:Uncharacterized protein n=1 Tax=Symplocastrum torsivum CPER-KK1 TaxID=450513 RepID=A0A951U7S6_9CYAN|nr:hypothetical protein [Symplocastrum torsivum CPER-KK1]
MSIVSVVGGHKKGDRNTRIEAIHRIVRQVRLLVKKRSPLPLAGTSTYAPEDKGTP